MAAVDTTIDDTTRRWICGHVQRALGTARVWNVVVKEQRVHGGRLKFKLHSEFGAALSNSSTFFFRAAYYTRCALIGRAGASPPSRSYNWAALSVCIYVFMYLCTSMYLSGVRVTVYQIPLISKCLYVDLF